MAEAKLKWEEGGGEEISFKIFVSSYFVNIFVRGAPVRSHETIYCPLARDHAQVTIQPGNRQ